MAVGSQANQGNVNQTLTQMALSLRTVMRQVEDFGLWVNGPAGIGLAGLEGLGFSPADAQTVLSFCGYMQNVAGCYYGTVQQGGTGGTGAVLFNFDSALSPLWAGQ
jgi:hypothetical protein